MENIKNTEWNFFPECKKSDTIINNIINSELIKTLKTLSKIENKDNFNKSNDLILVNYIDSLLSIDCELKEFDLDRVMDSKKIDKIDNIFFTKLKEMENNQK